MLTPKIYRRDSNGNIREWQGEAVAGRWRSLAGVVNGGLVVSEWSDAPAKSQATAEAQAEFEAMAQHDKHLAKDYRATVELVDVPRGSFIKPMLANIYPGFVGECYMQRKLDGMRNLANVDGLWSRGARPIVSAPHIEAALKSFFFAYPEIVLDGELYNHDLFDDFNRLMSIAKKTRARPEDIEESAKFLQYHVYDCYSLTSPEWSFRDRQLFLHEALMDMTLEHKCIQSVTTHFCASKSEVDELHMQFVGEGYEGSIIRLDRPYEQKRSSTLLKRKDFVTEEFEYLGCEEGEGNWRGVAKKIVIKTPGGKTVKPGLRGSKEFCQALLSAPVSKYQSVTVRHFGYTEDGSLRFPIAIAFHEVGSQEDRPPNATSPALDANSTETPL